MKLDRDVIRRQSFGAGFNGHRLDAKQAGDLKSGVLALRPHSVWRFDTASIDWTADPFQQRNWRAQFHMLRWLDPLRREALAGDAAARQLWLAIAASWVDAHTEPTAHDAFAWMDMVDAMRALSLTFGSALIDPNESASWLIDALVSHGEWLSDTNNIGHSNHALHQHQALFVLGRALKRNDWWRLAADRLRDLFVESYDAQGINSEGSIAYHKMNLQWWRDAFARLEVEDIVLPEEASRLNLAAEALAHATRPDGTFERIGDTELSSAAGLATAETDYASSKGARGTPPERLSAVYDRGYAFGRSGWGDHERDFEAESFYSLSFGSARRVHGHADGGSVTFFANGQPWAVDSGKYGYFPERDLRRFMLSREAHNVVTLEGIPHSRDANVVLVRSRSSTDADELILRDEGYRNVSIQRRVIYCRGGDFLIVVDDIEAPASVQASQLWHLPPDVTVSRDGDVFLLGGETARANLWTSVAPESVEVLRGTTDPLQGWVSDTWGSAEEAETILIRSSGSRIRFRTVLGAPHRNDLQVLRMDVDDRSMRIAVRANRTVFNVVSDEDSLTVVTGDSAILDTYGSSPERTLSEKVGDALRDTAPDWTASDDAENLRSLSTSQLVMGVKEYIYRQGGTISARLQGLSILAERNILVQSDQRDYGVRAGLVDIAGHDLPDRFGLPLDWLSQRREPVLAWAEGDLVPKNKTYGAPLRRLASVKNRVLEADEEVILSEDLGDLVLPALVRRQTSTVLTVRFHGALNRTRSVLPLFQGRTFDAATNNSYAIFQDPSLDLDSDLTLAWFLGRPEIDLHRRIAEAISQIRDATTAEHLVLSGSSGGGFAAMQVGTYLQDAHVLAINPQTDVTKYHRSSAERALAVCLGVVPGTSPDAQVQHRVSVLSRLENIDGNMKVLYVQNRGDDHHMRQHYKPLVDFLEHQRPDLASGFEFQMVDWGPGHQSTSRAEFSRLAAEVVERAVGGSG